VLKGSATLFLLIGPRIRKAGEEKCFFQVWEDRPADGSNLRVLRVGFATDFSQFRRTLV
jgi:hypothetical protein